MQTAAELDEAMNLNPQPKQSPCYQVKETEAVKTSKVNDTSARVYSIEGSVKVEFVSREVEAGAWLTPTQAAELIQLLQATFVE